MPALPALSDTAHGIPGMVWVGKHLRSSSSNPQLNTLELFLHRTLNFTPGA